jgi:hypothetical protein
MPATSYLSQKIIDLLTSNNTYAPPALWLSLHTDDPGIAGSHAFEVTAAGYVRQSLAGIMGPADPVTGISINTSPISFGPAGAPWGTINFLGLEGALTGGTMLAPGVPSVPKTVTIGQPFQIAVGNLRLRLI